jgi:hypothetical protein
MAAWLSECEASTAGNMASTRERVEPSLISWDGSEVIIQPTISDSDGP